MKQHLKRLTIPNSWPISRKNTKYIIRPKKSKPFKYSMPIALVFKNLLKQANTSKEVKNILVNNYVFVDGIRKLDIKASLALMETLEIKDHASYRLLLNDKGKFFLQEIDEKESKLRPSKITGKKLLKGNKTGINFQNGYNMIVQKDEYKVGDVLMIKRPENKVESHLKLEKGARVYMIGGKHVGKKGKIIDFDAKKITVEVGSHKFDTAKEYAFVIGKDKEAIKINTSD